ncbi:glutamine abc transporter, permease protein [Heliomicrobium modesticaldum Ice1]|uniref:Glutamine abc transporter, permease protein n=1 Tax=Heliobacterium modesticaldum (strain ATCC 51547 / Ice1) TaxID=498761 RepID=B0TGZ0_HELMI|nr:amino acid ABC transporter permease [Heliomicrobium modesticaldum]ABZ83315.1 glutamine abc transporter, permease protein [Heliomicrobium modesticaldum Ice1]
MDFKWKIVQDYADLFLMGGWTTVKVTAISVMIGTVIGLFIALARLSHWRLLRWVAAIYTDVIRGTPLLVQIFIVHLGAPKLIGQSLPAMTSGLIALSVNSGAYVAEIFRAGIQSIDKGQMEASRSLGMSYGQAMRFVILPQAFRRVIPPLGNEFIAMLKDSSLVSVISLPELTMAGRTVLGSTARVWEAWLPVAAIYLTLTLLFSRLVAWYEQKLSVKSHR